MTVSALNFRRKPWWWVEDRLKGKGKEWGDLIGDSCYS